MAGIIQLRTGNTFSGVLFVGFGDFWLSFFALGQRFLKAVPLTQLGHAVGLFIRAFGIFVVVMLAASFRTNVVVVRALTILAAAFFLLGAGNYGAHTTLIHRDRALRVLLWPSCAPGLVAGQALMGPR